MSAGPPSIDRVLEQVRVLFAFILEKTSWRVVFWTLVAVLVWMAYVSPYVLVVAYGVAAIPSGFAGIYYWRCQAVKARATGDRWGRLVFHICCAVTCALWLSTFVWALLTFARPNPTIGASFLITILCPGCAVSMMAFTRSYCRSRLKLSPLRVESQLARSVWESMSKLFPLEDELPGEPFSKAFAVFFGFCFALLIVGTFAHIKTTTPPDTTDTTDGASVETRLDCEDTEALIEPLGLELASRYSIAREMLPCALIDASGNLVITDVGRFQIVNLGDSDGGLGGIVLGPEGGPVALRADESSMLELIENGNVSSLTELTEVADGTQVRIARLDDGTCGLTLLPWGEKPIFVGTSEAGPLLRWFTSIGQWGRPNNDRAGSWRFDYPNVRAVPPPGYAHDYSCPTAASVANLAGVTNPPPDG
jgi:hypothetical protein